jgi:aminoglycoside N3'-acetyltransferase
MTELRPLTETLVADLRRIGLAQGDAVLVRCAARPIAPRAKAVAGTLLDALLEVVGPTGTVVALTFTDVQKATEKKPVAKFSDDARTTAGSFSTAVLGHPARKRSTHPSNSIAAIGVQADFLVDAHTEQALPFSWIRRLIEISGKQLVIGCVTQNINALGFAESPGLSTVHFTQEELGLSDKTFLSGTEGCFVAGPGGEPRWVPRIHMPGCSMGFWKMYGHYVRAGILRAGMIGEAYSILGAAPEAAEVERAIMAENPRAVLCDRPDCLSCGSWSYARRRLPGLASATLLLKAKGARKKILRRRSPRTAA